MKKNILIFLFMLFMISVVYAESSVKKANHYDWEVTENFTYDRGNYDGDSLTQTAIFDTAMSRFFEKGDVTFNIPIVAQTSDSEVTLVRGALQRVRRTRSHRVTKSGLGDMYVTGSYYLLSENMDPFDFSLKGYLKFPTANSSDGLGTGELDAGPGMGFGKRFLPELRGFTDFYYIFIGDPSGIDLRNQISFDFGASYDFSQEVSASMTYEQSRSLIKGKENPKDLAFGVNCKLNDTTRVFGGIAFGLSDTASDVSLNIGGGIKF